MSDSIVIIVLTMGAFVSTGVDNLLLHIGFMGQDPVSDRQVNLGVLGAYLVILSLGLGASYAADLFPSRYIGFWGLVPLTMGVLRLFRAIRGPGQGTAHEPSGMANSWSVGLVMLANNGDSLAVLTPCSSKRANHPHSSLPGPALPWPSSGPPSQAGSPDT